jgi:hypothetical protein
MRKLLIFLLAFMIVGAASGLPMFGPAQGFRNPGNIEVGGTLSIGGANIVAGTVTYDDITQAAYVNETAINTSLAALTLAAYVNETAINTSLAALTIAAYTNETAINATAANVALGQAVQNATAANVALGQAAQNATLANLALGQTAQNNTAANVALGQTWQNTTLANLALGETYQNTTMANLALGQTWQNTTASNVAAGQTAQNVSITNLGLGNTAQNSSITANKQSDYINQTAINASIGALVVPLATFDYVAASVDQGVFTASGGWVLTAVKMTPRVIGSDGGAVTVMLKICDSGEAPTSGDNMLSGTLDLKGTADTPQSGTVSAGTIANGKIVALDFTGTLTDAVGTITLYGTRA